MMRGSACREQEKRATATVNNGESNTATIAVTKERTKEMAAKPKTRENMVMKRGRIRIAAGRMINDTKTTERATVTRTTSNKTSKTSTTGWRRRG